MKILNTAKHLIEKLVFWKQDGPPKNPSLGEPLEARDSPEKSVDAEKEKSATKDPETSFLPAPEEPAKPAIAFVLSDVGELRNFSEKSSVTKYVEESDKPVADITTGVSIWTRIMQQAAGTKMVVWSPNTVQSTATIDTKSGLIKERILLEVENLPKATYAFLQPGLKEIQNSEVKSIRVDDGTSPVSTIFSEDPMFAKSFVMDTGKLPPEVPAPDISNDSLREMVKTCSPEFQRLLNRTVCIGDLDEAILETATDRLVAGILRKRLEAAKW